MSERSTNHLSKRGTFRLPKCIFIRIFIIHRFAFTLLDEEGLHLALQLLVCCCSFSSLQLWLCCMRCSKFGEGKFCFFLSLVPFLLLFRWCVFVCLFRAKRILQSRREGPKKGQIEAKNHMEKDTFPFDESIFTFGCLFSNCRVNKSFCLLLLQSAIEQFFSFEWINQLKRFERHKVDFDLLLLGKSWIDSQLLLLELKGNKVIFHIANDKSVLWSGRGNK